MTFRQRFRRGLLLGREEPVCRRPGCLPGQEHPKREEQRPPPQLSSHQRVHHAHLQVRTDDTSLSNNFILKKFQLET